MKLTKEQRAARSKAIEQAAIAALRKHFVGEGATARRWKFLGEVLLASVGWFARLLVLGSWAVIGGLLVGPDHDYFLMKLHAWMVAMPVDQVLAQSNALFLSAAWAFAKMGLVIGVGQRLLAVVESAAKQAKQQFETAAT